IVSRRCRTYPSGSVVGTLRSMLTRHEVSDPGDPFSRARTAGRSAAVINPSSPRGNGRQTNGTSPRPRLLRRSVDDVGGNFRAQSFRTRPPGAFAPRHDRQHGRHDDRVVRLPALRPGDGTGVWQTILPQIGSTGRRARGVCLYILGCAVVGIIATAL